MRISLFVVHHLHFVGHGSPIIHIEYIEFEYLRQINFQSQFVDLLDMVHNIFSIEFLALVFTALKGVIHLKKLFESLFLNVWEYRVLTKDSAACCKLTQQLLILLSEFICFNELIFKFFKFHFSFNLVSNTLFIFLYLSDN